MWDVFTNLVAPNMGMNFENIILFVLTVSLLVFFAVDFRVGAILELLASAGLFIWFHEAGLNFTPALVVFFMWLVILSFSIYAVAKAGSRPGGAFI